MGHSINSGIFGLFVCLPSFFLGVGGGVVISLFLILAVSVLYSHKHAAGIKFRISIHLQKSIKCNIKYIIFVCFQRN